jgi:hypothetical protein
MSNNNFELDREGLELLLAFDSKHYGRTAQLEAYTATIKSLENQPALQAQFISSAIEAYKTPTGVTQ